MTTKQAPQVFTFIPGIDIRVAQNDGRLWFLAMDVCAVLGTDTKDIRRLLDSPDISTTNLESIEVKHRGKAPLLVSEQGLYKLAVIVYETTLKTRGFDADNPVLLFTRGAV